MTHKNDIVVTGLWGCCWLLEKHRLNQNGLIFSSSNMDKLLFERHLGQKVRRAEAEQEYSQTTKKMMKDLSALIKVIENAEKAETELLG